MIRLIKTFWKSFLFLMLIFGIFWLPKDVQDASQAAEPWRRAAAAIFNQNIALWLALVLMGGWIIWTDVRPYVRAWRTRSRSPIKIANHMEMETQRVRGPDGVNADDVFALVFCLQVSNERIDRKTLRNVRANFYMIGPPQPLAARHGNPGTVDIHHGEHVRFEVGLVYFGSQEGWPSQRVRVVTAEQLVGLRHNIPIGSHVFEVLTDDPDAMRFMQPTEVDLGPSPFYVTVSADDVESATVRVQMYLRKLPHVGRAFAVESI